MSDNNSTHIEEADNEFLSDLDFLINCIDSVEIYDTGDLDAEHFILHDTEGDIHIIMIDDDVYDIPHDPEFLQDSSVMMLYDGEKMGNKDDKESVLKMEIQNDIAKRFRSFLKNK